MSPSPHTAAGVTRALKHLGSPERATSSARFFKTAKGQYGYGDKFYGVSVPEQRLVAKEFRDLPLTEIEKLLASGFHENRLTALIVLCSQFAKGDDRTRTAIYKFYLSHTTFINNWDLVDTSAHKIVGEYLLERPREPLYTLVKSPSLWERRIAIVATFAYIPRGQFDDTYKISELLLNDTHDLIHKATGWALREMGKKSKATLISFLNKHAHEMPRTMLRYSLEKLTDEEKARYMNAKNHSEM